MARILTAAEEIGWLTLSGLMLVRAGHEVVKIKNEADILPRLHDERFDLVILADRWGNRFSAALAEAVLEADPEMPLVIYTPSGQESFFTHLDIKAFLRMPVAQQHLIDVVTQFARPPLAP